MGRGEKIMDGRCEERQDGGGEVDILFLGKTYRMPSKGREVRRLEIEPLAGRA